MKNPVIILLIVVILGIIGIAVKLIWFSEPKDNTTTPVPSKTISDGSELNTAA